MKKELKDALQKLSENEEITLKLEDLYSNDPESFVEKSLEILNENGVILSKEDLNEQEISLEDLEQIAGGFDVYYTDEKRRRILEAFTPDLFK